MEEIRDCAPESVSCEDCNRCPDGLSIAKECSTRDDCEGCPNNCYCERQQKEYAAGETVDCPYIVGVDISKTTDNAATYPDPLPFP